MKSIHRRIGKLENRFCPTDLDWLLVMSAVAGDLALSNDRCIEILRECEHLPTGPGFGTVRLWEIPDGLNAQELEKYLREHGAVICGSRGAQRMNEAQTET